VKWRKLGCVYVAEGRHDWARSHAYIPTPTVMDDGMLRVYCAFLDNDQVGRPGYVDLAVDNPLKVLRVSERPVLDVGEPGTFDDSGVTPTCILRHKDTDLMYYFGWQRGIKQRYYLFAGLAVKKKNEENFKRYSQVPLLDRKDGELFVRSAPYVLHDGGVFKMWYASGSSWVESGGKTVPTYNLRYTESMDGLSWTGKSKVCLDLAEKDEIGFGRPYIIKDRQLYKMWYSLRTFSKHYRIVYAESNDGLRWQRKDAEAGIDISESGWDSEMVCFAAVVDVRGKRFMFYNGNEFGKTGFGVAVQND
jgi:hypothetical protein